MKPHLDGISGKIALRNARTVAIAPDLGLAHVALEGLPEQVQEDANQDQRREDLDDENADRVWIVAGHYAQHVVRDPLDQRIEVVERWMRAVAADERLVQVGALLLGDETDMGFRYRYMGGRLYTPMQGGLETRCWIEPGDALNASRMPDYRRLDLRWDHKFILSGWRLSWYVEIQNVPNPNGCSCYCVLISTFVAAAGPSTRYR